MTHPLGAVRLGLRLAPLSLALADAPDSAWSFAPLQGLTDGQAGAALAQMLSARGLDGARLDAGSPYAMPDCALAHGAKYAAGAAFAELASWFANAERAVAKARQRFAARGIDAPPARCWPHHFDLATLAAFPGADGATAYVGAGLSPGDHYYAEPYFYVSLYPPPAIADLTALPAIGHWRDHEFTAAIAPAHAILAAADRAAAVEAFLSRAIDSAIGRLAGRG